MRRINPIWPAPRHDLAHEPPLGFIGLGVMGLPMAGKLLEFGRKLVVWNRTADKCGALWDRGATVAASAQAVFAAAPAVILMLATEAAIDEVLLRGTPEFASRVADRLVINMGTVSPGYSAALEHDLAAAGARYVEAPVSGSRKPAEDGQLVAMLAGAPAAVAEARTLLAPMCKRCFACGAVPAALEMKLAVNLYLITMVTGLCEAFHFSRLLGLDAGLLREILNAGPMASSVSTLKLDKLVKDDLSVQASIADVLKNAQLIADHAALSHIESPLLEQSRRLFAETLDLGHGELDMAAVVKAIEARTEARRGTTGQWMHHAP